MNALYITWRPGCGDVAAEPGIVQRDRSGWRPVGRLEYDDAQKLYKFFYVEGARMPPFCPFSKMDDLESVYYSEKLFPLFASRLFPHSRKRDYEDFLRWSGFAPNSRPNPILLLGISEGRKQTDAVEVFPCPDQQENGSFYRVKFFVHGIRHQPLAAQSRINKLNTDECLFPHPDDNNKYDKFAVGMWTQDNVMIGYLPRYFAEDCRSLLNGCGQVSVIVVQVNDDAPPQSRILCTLEACCPEDFVPCSTPDFLPIPASERNP